MESFFKFLIFIAILFFSTQSFSQQLYNVQRGQRGYIPPPKYEASAYITTLDVYEELNMVLPMCVASFSLDEFETQILKGMLMKKFDSYNAVVSNTDLSKDDRQDQLKQLEIDFVKSLTIILTPDEITTYVDMDFTDKKKGKKKAKGDRAVYLEQLQKIILTGNPKAVAWEADDIIEGREMIFLMKKNRFVVNERVKAKIYTQKP